MSTEREATLPKITRDHVNALWEAQQFAWFDHPKLDEILSVLRQLEDGTAVIVIPPILEKISDLALLGSVDKYPRNALHQIARIVDALIPEYTEARHNESREALRSQFGDEFVNAVDALSTTDGHLKEKR